MNKKYSNDDITILWQPDKCIHAAECIKALPKVYNPTERPWLKIENASTEQLKAQIKLCPSGALSYEENSPNATAEAQPATQVQVLPNGPLLILGDLEVKNKAGEVQIKKNATAFCRCGHSENKPYCDGSHLRVQFKD